MKLTLVQQSNISLAMYILERCRHWALLTSELALFNAGLELTHPDGDFDLPLSFCVDVKVPDTLRQVVASVIDHGVVESIRYGFVVEGITSHCFIEGDTVALVGGSDVVNSRSKGEFPLLKGLVFFVCSFLVIEICQLFLFSL